MAGAMRKMAVYLGLVEDEDPEFYDEDGYDDTAGAVARRGDAPAPLRVTRPDETAVSYTPPRRAAAEAVDGYRITTMHPRTYNEARTIGEHFARARRSSSISPTWTTRMPSDSSTSPPAWCSACTAASSGSPTRSSC